LCRRQIFDLYYFSARKLSASFRAFSGQQGSGHLAFAYSTWLFFEAALMEEDATLKAMREAVGAELEEFSEAFGTIICDTGSTDISH
jgi:hypothetical protein